MPRGFQKDRTLTALAHEGMATSIYPGILMDRRSFISKPKLTHGEVPVPHLILYGKDVEAARERAMQRAIYDEVYGHICQKCHILISDRVHELDEIKAHMRHILDKPWNRCWCDANLEMVCLACHRLDHGDGRLG